MEFLRRATNPWGQEVLVGVAWDLMWAAVIAGLGFIVVHAIYARWFAPKSVGTEQQKTGTAAPGIPARVQRHTLSARMFHWLMAVAMFVLLIHAQIVREEWFLDEQYGAAYRGYRSRVCRYFCWPGGATSTR